MDAIYLPLEEARKEIRLIDLLPGNWDDPIQSHLRIVSLNDAPSYKVIFRTALSTVQALTRKALSYVWGPRENLLEIQVNGHQVG